MTRKHNNSFDALRITAALAVIVSHAYQTTSGKMSDVPLYMLSNSQTTLGGVGVIAFFGISGYLVTQSWFRRKNAKDFLMARVLRIWPALILLIFTTTFVIGPLLTTSASYWQDAATWDFLSNLLLHQPEEGWRTLPGVFENNPLSGVVIGTLWTLEYEFFAYIAVATLGSLRLINRESATVIVIILALALWRIPMISQQPWIYLILPFATGAALSQYGKTIWRRDVALLCVILSISSPFIYRGMFLLLGTAGIYALIYVGRSAKLSGWGKYGDPSYGLYLWGMLIQQILVSFGYGLTPMSNLALALAITTPIAYLSWHILEKRVLEYARKPKLVVQS